MSKYKGTYGSALMTKEGGKAMETYREDFSVEGNELPKGCSKLEELINNRQIKFSLTTDYRETDSKIKDFLNKLKDLPEAKEIVGKLDDEITHLECMSFSVGYRDGVSDLMAALTFNKLGLTSVEYYKYKAS
ncbi:MAG TPA: hypothetical protein VN370_13290 [Desulfitobacteriaceae bacterium]|nr:hypothetical protein [Desulfitobacteriaceae bacterium]